MVTVQTRVTDFTTELRKWKKTDDRQIALTNCVVTYIAKNLLPVSTVESTAFRNLLEMAQPAFAVPSRKHLCTNLIPERYTTLHENLKIELQQAPGVSLTMDLWSSRDMRAYIGMTAHYMLEYKLRSALHCWHAFDFVGYTLVKQFTNAILISLVTLK